MSDNYGRANAACYDEVYPRIDRRALALLQRLAGSGPALELGVGTGRCALPLAELGVPVVGLDSSTEMLARCRYKDFRGRVALVLGDLARLPFRAAFTLVYSLVNTLSLLEDRRSQAQAIAEIAQALRPGGYFLDEGGAAEDISLMTAPISCAVPWPTAPQGVYRMRHLPISATLLDDYVRQAGLVRVARWRDWSAAPWQPTDVNAISLYRRGLS